MTRAFRFQLPLNRPLSLGRVVLRDRVGVLLEQSGEWAEASPLPSFSRESFDDVVHAIKNKPISDGRALPSLAFAVDSLACPITPCRVPINALLQGSPADVLAQAEQLRNSAISTAKLKVGRTDVAAEIKLVRQIRSTLRSDQRLRLDANRAWSFGEAETFARSVVELDIEYIEEPLQDSDRCEELFRRYAVPYALDETLTEMKIEDDIHRTFPSVAALVCKPTLQGGRDRIAWLAKTNKPIVFSAAFESGIGIARIAQWANEFSPNVPAGLDTYSWLENDLLHQPLIIEDGVLEVPSQLQPMYCFMEEINLR